MGWSQPCFLGWIVPISYLVRGLWLVLFSCLVGGFRLRRIGSLTCGARMSLSTLSSSFSPTARTLLLLPVAPWPLRCALAACFAAGCSRHRASLAPPLLSAVRLPHPPPWLLGHALAARSTLAPGSHGHALEGGRIWEEAAPALLPHVEGGRGATPVGGGHCRATGKSRESARGARDRASDVG